MFQNKFEMLWLLSHFISNNHV